MGVCRCASPSALQMFALANAIPELVCSITGIIQFSIILAKTKAIIAIAKQIANTVPLSFITVTEWQTIGLLSCLLERLQALQTRGTGSTGAASHCALLIIIQRGGATQSFP